MIDGRGVVNMRTLISKRKLRKLATNLPKSLGSQSEVVSVVRKHISFEDSLSVVSVRIVF